MKSHLPSPSGGCPNCPRPPAGPGRFWSDRGHRGALIILGLLGLGLGQVPLCADGRYLMPLLLLTGPGMGCLIGRTYADGWTVYPAAYAAGLAIALMAGLETAVFGLTPVPFSLVAGLAGGLAGWLAGRLRHGR